MKTAQPVKNPTPVKLARRQVTGILCLDKPTGISSNAALQTVKRLFIAKKAGHTGSLDPLASGMLPLCFGQATKFSQFLLEADKTYQVTARLGIRTTTSDSEGEVVSEREIPSLNKTDLNRLLDEFRGEISQIPSMYSALKYQGQPLYKLARQGITVPRQPRQLNIYQLEITALTATEVSLLIRCSKGTYVRTLVDDIGERLGCGAHVSYLHRSEVGPYQAEQMVSLAALQALVDENQLEKLDQFLLPVESMVSDLPSVQVNNSVLFYLQQGQEVFVADTPDQGLVKIKSLNDKFLGVGEITDTGKVASRRLLRN